MKDNKYQVSCSPGHGQLLYDRFVYGLIFKIMKKSFLYPYEKRCWLLYSKHSI